MKYTNGPRDLRLGVLVCLLLEVFWLLLVGFVFIF